MRKKGFTLVELLVVLAVIALLAAILLPAYSAVRRSARKSWCQGNLHQMSLAIAQYTRDYDDHYPFTAYANAGNPNDVVYWYMATLPYHKQPNLFLCPDGVLQVGGNAQGASHYGANAMVLRSEAFEETGLVHPSDTYLLMDGGSFFMAPNYFLNLPGSLANPHYLPGMGNAAGIAAPQIDSRYQADYERGRHNGGLNVAYCDGHVKWQSPQAMIAEAKLPAPRQFGAWNPAN